MFRQLKKKLRNYVRVRTNYISPEQANKVKNKLAVVYALTAWNLFGFVVLSIYKEKIPKTHDSYDYAKVLGVQESKVVKFSGFTKVDEYDQTLTSEDLREFRETIGSKEEKAKYEAQNEERMRKLQK